MEEPNEIVLKKNKGLSGTFLKNVAMLTMFLDHFAVAFIFLGILLPISQDFLLKITQQEVYNQWFVIHLVFREVARISFPLFAFLCAVGYYHTKNPKHYILRLFAFAFISEYPFDLAFFPQDIGFFSHYQNVYWTLAFSVLGLWLYEEALKILPKSLDKLAFIFLAASLWLTALMKADYFILGNMMVYGFYFFRFDKKAGALFYLFLYGWRGTSLLALPLMSCYSGEQGISRYPFVRYLFYAFYPVHLILLYGLRMWYLR